MIVVYDSKPPNFRDRSPWRIVICQRCQVGMKRNETLRHGLSGMDQVGRFCIPAGASNGDPKLIRFRNMRLLAKFLNYHGILEPKLDRGRWEYIQLFVERKHHYQKRNRLYRVGQLAQQKTGTTLFHSHENRSTITARFLS